jgi:hypothetical protein|tara:strand:- start:1355 stop:2218 length:864 start_codon:yes stop_codon:yes gene_type:complete
MSELFDGASDYSSSGISSLADAQDAYSNQGRSFGPPQNTDQRAEQVIQNVLANVGTRSNIRGSTNYNPIFAQALNMSRGLQPGNRVAGDYYGADNFKGIADLARPSYLTPQVPGEKGMYFSGAERFLQETLPPIIQQIRKASPTGIIQNLIEQGQDAYNKGKDLYDETFKDTPFRRYNYDNEQQNKAPVGIMENMNRADETDLQKALQFGYNTNPFSRPDLATQTADLNLRELITSPGVIGKALSYTQPYIQNILPEGINFDAGTIYNEKEEEFQPRIQFTIPFSTG